MACARPNPLIATSTANANDDFIRTLGKAAIVEAIAFKERKSKLFGDKGGLISGRSEIDDTWYWTFVKMLLEGSPPREKLFDNIGVVCFNYDRCIEHYLTCELMRSFSIERKEAADLVNRLTIWHPYGTIASARHARAKRRRIRRQQVHQGSQLSTWHRASRRSRRSTKIVP